MQKKTFRSFLGRYLYVLWGESFAWARDNIGWAAFVLICPPLAVYLGTHRTDIDWQMFRTSLWLYAGALTLYLVVHYIRTAWKLDVNRIAEIEQRDVLVARETAKYEIERDKHIDPLFQIRFGQMLTFYNPNLNLTVLCMHVRVTNFGAASPAMDWRVTYQCGGAVVPKPFSVLTADETPWPVLCDGKMLVLKKDEMLSKKTLAKMERGDCLQGRLLFEFDGDITREIMSGAATIWLHCSDFNGKSFGDGTSFYPASGFLTWEGEELRELPSDFDPLKLLG